MRKIFIFALLVISTTALFAQEVKHLSAYVKPTGESRYAISMTNNTIWWADPNDGKWTNVLTNGLPKGFEIKNLAAYIKPNGQSRYVISLADHSIWWADPNEVSQRFTSRF